MFNVARKLVKGRRDREQLPRHWSTVSFCIWPLRNAYLLNTYYSYYYWSLVIEGRAPNDWGKHLLQQTARGEHNFLLLLNARSYDLANDYDRDSILCRDRAWECHQVMTSLCTQHKHCIIIKESLLSFYLFLTFQFLIQKSNKPYVVWDRYTRGAREFHKGITNTSSPICIQVARGVWTFSRCAFPNHCSRLTDLANSFMAQALCSLWLHPVWRAFDRHQAERRRRMGVSLYTSRRGNEEYHR